MRLNNIRYFLTEGLKSFWVNGLMSAASVMIVTASLIIFGIYLTFSYNLSYLSQQLQSKFEIQISLPMDISDANAKKVGEQLRAIEHVADAKFFSREEALQDCRARYGADAGVLDGLEADNPLPHYYKITLDDLSRADTVIAAISKVPNIDTVMNNKYFMDKLLSITAVVRHISIWLVILLSVIAVFIISNTIKLTVFARRRDINIMKFLGATDWFISWPFVIEGVIIGFIGAVLSLTLVSVGYQYILEVAQPLVGNEMQFYRLSELLPQTSLWFGVFGVVLGALGSAISLRRYLHV